eukprot:TRINITY_DN3630_c0_g1_i1.p1 TRINITY_DN3630_c0_g1~~TRINITY_DN3630_c0_g1_i1.p1  ORF type:complete len:734 (+),score=216.76 TRINITY_DN3630_c0_g1_i1:91-2292(+)
MRGRSAAAARLLAGVLVAAAAATLQQFCFVGFQASSPQPRRSSRVTRGFFAKPGSSSTATLEPPAAPKGRAPRERRERRSSNELSVGSKLEVLFAADNKWYPAEVIQTGDEPTVKFAKDGYEYTTVAKTFRVGGKGAKLGGSARKPARRLRKGPPPTVGEKRYAYVVTINEEIGVAFVDIGAGKEVILHKSQIAKAFITNIRDVLTEGDRVTVWVTNINDNGGIGVTMKNPEGVSVQEANLKVGQRRWGVISGVNDTIGGAFVDIGYNEPGFLHMSKIARAFINTPSEFLATGRKVEVVVDSIDGDRVGLSMIPPSLEDKELHIGQKVRAVVAAINEEVGGAYLDYGRAKQGFLHKSNVKAGFVKTIEGELYKGQQVTAYIERIEDDKVGLSLLPPSTESKIAAGQLFVGKRVKGVVKAVNTELKAAFVDIGLAEDALLPAALTAPGFVKDLTQNVWEGQTVDAWINVIKGDRKKVTISLYPPQTIEEVEYEKQYVGVVTGVSDEHGLAFIDVGAKQQGAIHVQELKKQADRGDKVSDHVKVGYRLWVRRMKNTHDDSKIRFKLSGRQLSKPLQGLSVGDELQGTVKNVVDSMGAAFVDVGVGSNALLHIADTPAADPKGALSAVLSVDQAVTVYIKKLDMKRAEVVLTMLKDKVPNFAPFVEAQEAQTVLPATVVGLNDKGVFVEVEAGGSKLQGRMHKENVPADVAVGAEVSVQVMYADAKVGKLHLTMAA